MIFSTHYYVLTLSTESTVLYEAFRDTLIRVENQGFPVTPTTPASSHTGHDDPMRELMRTVDACFDFYDSRERLGLLLVGDEDLQAAFDAVTTHGSAVVGRVKGDRSGARASDLGQIVWPVVKEIISAVRERALRDLQECSREGRVVSSLEAVAEAATIGSGGTLLVEDEYRVRGSLAPASRRPLVSREVDVRDVNDDAVDAVIERVLSGGGNVVFMGEGALASQERIALLLPEAARP
jgi:hypothetical protein